MEFFRNFRFPPGFSAGPLQPREARRMFMHNKRLMYTVRVGAPDPKLANLILEQFGGPDGELAAAMRYFTQGLAESIPAARISSSTSPLKNSATWRWSAASSRC